MSSNISTEALYTPSHTIQLTFPNIQIHSVRNKNTRSILLPIYVHPCCFHLSFFCSPNSLSFASFLSLSSEEEHEKHLCQGQALSLFPCSALWCPFLDVVEMYCRVSPDGFTFPAIEFPPLRLAVAGKSANERVVK